jgi:ankyrin repeat protein
MHGNLDTVKYLIDRLGASITKTNKNDENCLIVAVRNKQLEIVRYLCKFHVKPNGDLDADYESKRNGLTAFARACLQSSFKIADYILKHTNANKNYINKLEQKSIIVIAINHKLKKVVEYLANLNVNDD